MLYSVKEVAELSGKTEQWIRRQVKTGCLPHTTDAQGRVWIAEEDIPVRRVSASDLLFTSMQLELESAQARFARSEAGGEARAGGQRRSSSVRPFAVGARKSELNELPETRHGLARWIERHGGPQHTDDAGGSWAEMVNWSGIPEALETMRRRGYPPKACKNPVCGCHSALRSE